MKEKIINLIEDLRYWDKNYILQGSYSLYIRGVIERMPNDIDILLFNDNDLYKRNEYWEICKKNYKVVEESINHEFYNSIKIIGNKNKILNLECMKFKAIPDSYIEKIGDIKVIKLDMMVGFKVCQLLTSYVINKTKPRTKKIINSLLDLNKILEKLPNMNFINIVKESMFFNIPYEMYVYKNSPYSNLIDENFHKFLISILPNQEYIESLSRVFDLLNKLKNDEEIIKTIKQIENIFQLKKEFRVYIDMSMTKMGIIDVKRYGYYYWFETDEKTLQIFSYIVAHMTISDNSKSLLAMQALEFKNNKYCINLHKLLLLLSQ
ncbi:hypothetical protein ACNQ1X_03215 [Mycoplasma sp. SK341A]|uniref:hypothetical protein n=1 Tax=unclassified Mycoplasma TaxID=2683645 RepID=UPI003AAC0C08